MPSLYKLGVVDHPKAAEVVLVADETLVQRQIRADCVLHFGGAEDRKRKGKEGKISSSSSNLVGHGCGGGEGGAIVMDICTHLARSNKPII